MIEAMRGIDVQLPFETTARWAQRSRVQASPIRSAVTIEPATALSRFGNNLANAFNTLKNDFSEEHWRETMDYVRLGLGYDVESINTRADPGGGSIALRLKYAGLDQQVPAFSLSDGMLSYMCFVALFRLNTQKSMIAFDEPETHLHPELLMRVLDFFEALAEERPIVLATHSDRLLDGLSDPARSVVLCELDEHKATRLVLPDAEALTDWLKDYRGLGDVRSAGHAASVLTRRDAP
jgi:predicted ATPase